MHALVGTGMHGGLPSRVAFVRHSGPARLVVEGVAQDVTSLQVARTTRSTAVATTKNVVSTVEHAFAALAGAGLWRGVSVELEGDEMPLLDGGAARFFDALAALELTPQLPPTRVARAAKVEVGDSVYELEPHDGVHVEVTLVWGDDRLAPSASWSGSSEDFRSRIATARTFAFERDLPMLTDSRLARHVDPESVVVIATDIHFAGRAFAADEPARHKLLDLIGDAYLHGGPPIGRVRAFRPGHAANHAAFMQARELGVIVPRVP